MAINVEIAFAANFQRGPRMLSQRFQHVIKEANTGIDVCCASVVEIPGDGNVGFFGGAINRG